MFRRAAVPLAVVLLCTVVIGLPVSDLGGHVPLDPGDPLLNVWALRWESTALLRDPGAFYDGNTFWPASTSIAYSESMVPLVPVFAVLRVITGDDLAANALLVLLLVLAAVGGAYALARRFVRSPGAAVLAGLSYGLGAYVLAHTRHVQLLTLGSFPLVFLLWFRALERRTWTAAIGCGLAVAAASLASLYYALVLAPCLAAMAVVHVVLTGQWRERRTLATIALVAVVAAAATAPGLLPYRLLDDRQGLGRPIEPMFDLRLDDLVTPTPENVLYEGLGERGARDPTGGEHALFPGFVVLGLAAVGAVGLVVPRLRRSVERRRQVELAALVAAAAVAVVLALGAEVRGVPMPFRYLHDHVPGFGGIRATARFAVPALLVLGVLAAVALDGIVRRLRPPWSKVVVGGAAVVLAAELWAPVPWVRVDEDEQDLAVYQALDEAPPGPVVELPMASPFPYAEGPPLVWEQTEPIRMVRSLVDGNPRVNGYSGHHPYGYFDRLYALNRFPAADAVAAVEELGVRYVVLHTGLAADGHQQYDEAAAAGIVERLPRGWDARRVGSAWLLTAPTDD